MAANSTYNYTSSEGFIIENGILKGVELSSYVDDPRTNFGEFLLERLRDNPKFIGQIDGVTGRRETLGEMMEKSVKCAMWLRKENFKPGDVIGICTHNQMDMYVPCFASLFIGAVFNPWWDAGITKELARHFLNLTKPKIIFINETSASLAAEVAAEIGMEIKMIIIGKLSGFLSLEDILETQDDKLIGEFRCSKLSTVNDPAVIMYTSGTSGLPKGVLHLNRSLFGLVSHITKMIKNEEKMTTLFFSPLGWMNGVLFILRGIISCETRINYPEFTEEKTLELIEKYNVNWLFLGPSPATRLYQSSSVNDYRINSLKYLWLGGSVVKEETQKAMALTFPTVNVLQCYGCTEIGCLTIQKENGGKFGSCGTIIDNTLLKVIDPLSGRILGPNETGEACFKSPFIMSCYHDNPKATEETIDPEGWLHTGDLVHYDEEGHIFVTDRIKEIIKYRGYHVSPAMVEQVLQKHPEVIEAAVVGISHNIDEEHPIAFVTKTPNSKVTKDELEKLVADVLPDYMRLRGGVEFIEKIPHTLSGKIARSDLKKLAKSLY